MKKYFPYIIILFSILFLISCASHTAAQKDITLYPETETKSQPIEVATMQNSYDLSSNSSSKQNQWPSYSKAVPELGAKILNRLKQQQYINGELIYLKSKSYFIHNKGKQRKLATQFIEDLGSYLINHGVNIKRKEISTWDSAAKNSYKVRCQEVLNTIKSDFLIELSLVECPESDRYIGAKVTIIPEQSNNVIFSDKQYFQFKGNIVNWYNDIVPLRKFKGEDVKNPYSNYIEAANNIVGELTCIASNILQDEISIIIGKTERTSKEIALAFKNAATRYGFEVVLNEAWLAVALKAEDQFELGIYQSKHHENYGTANVILAIDAKNVKDNATLLTASLLNINSIPITVNSKSKILEPGTALPYCSISRFTSSHIIDNRVTATGIGLCKKNRDAALWQHTANKAAEVVAKRNLIAKVIEEVKSTFIMKDYTIEEDRIESKVNAIIREPEIIRTKFDEQKCIAEVEMKVDRDNIQMIVDDIIQKSPLDRSKDISVDPKQNKHTKSYSSQSKKPTLPLEQSSQKIVTDSRSNRIILRDLNTKLYERLKKDSIEPGVLNFISIAGDVSSPDCRHEEHYMWPKGVPSRYYCGLDYSLKLSLKNHELFSCNGHSMGRGSGKSYAWNDALTGVVENIYPLVFDIVSTISEKETIQRLRNTFENLDNTSWQFSEGVDIDSVLDLIERQIASLDKEL